MKFVAIFVNMLIFFYAKFLIRCWAKLLNEGSWNIENQHIIGPPCLWICILILCWWGLILRFEWLLLRMNSEAFLEFEVFLKLHSFKFDFQFAFKSYDPWKFLAIPTKDACSENATPQAEHCNSSSHSVNAPSGGSIKQMVLKSAALEHTIRSLKLESGESEQQLRKRAAEILDLMGTLLDTFLPKPSSVRDSNPRPHNLEIFWNWA